MIDYEYSYFDKIEQNHIFKLKDSFCISAMLWTIVWNEIYYPPTTEKSDSTISGSVFERNFIYIHSKLGTVTTSNSFLKNELLALFLILLKNINKEIQTVSIFPSAVSIIYKNNFTISVNFQLDSLGDTLDVNSIYIDGDCCDPVFSGYFSFKELDYITKDGI